jgi:hypothetical protein
VLSNIRPGIRAALTLAAVAASFSLAVTPTAAEAQARRLIRFSAPEILLPEHEFALIGDVAVGADGAVYVADIDNNEVIQILPNGRLGWRVGRSGSGPGEFRMPYRLAAHPDGGVSVLDWGLGRITAISRHGAVAGTYRLPFNFTQIDGMLILADGRYVIAGMTLWGGNAAAHSVHVFTDSVQYRLSFAPHSESLDSMAVRYTGSGGIAKSGNDQVLFTRKRPFEVHLYDASGRSSRIVSVGAPVALGLHDLIEVRQFNNQTVKSVGARSREVEIPVPAQQLPGGGFVSGRATFAGTTVDLISASGALESSTRQPLGCLAIVAIDAARNTIYCRGARNSEPVLIRARFSIL